MNPPQSARLVVAVLLAVSIHAAAATGILLNSPAPDPATDQGEGGVMLLIASTAAGSSAAPETPARMQPEEPPVEKTPAAREPEPEPETVRSQKPVQRTSIEKQSGLKPVVRAHRERKVASPRADAVPVPRRKPTIQKKVTEKKATDKPLSLAADRPQNPREPDTSETNDSPLAATNGNNGLSHQTQTAKSSGGKRSEHGAYLVAVRNWLHQHKRYPRRARLRMMRGEAVIGFVLNRSGRVVSYELRRSTGHDILDREVLAMVRRASPMPSFPPDLTRERMGFSLPVKFDIH